MIWLLAIFTLFFGIYIGLYLRDINKKIDQLLQSEPESEPAVATPSPPEEIRYDGPSIVTPKSPYEIQLAEEREVERKIREVGNG